MGKNFIEYHNENGRIPYSGVTLCFCLTQYVRNYIKENRSVIANIDSNVRDAVLVDAINYLAYCGGVDFGLSTKSLYNGIINEEKVDGQCLLTTVQNFYAKYIFENGIVESVLRNNHMNECTTEFNPNDGAIVLVDFINYLAQVNDYDRKFTIKDLYEKFLDQENKAEMKRLKTFLKKTSKYTKKLSEGKNIDEIFAEMSREHRLGSISEDGTYYYTDLVSHILGRCEMYSWAKREVEDEIYAMAYAYGKMSDNIKEPPQTEIIYQKLLEMNKR